MFKNPIDNLILSSDAVQRMYSNIVSSVLAFDKAFAELFGHNFGFDKTFEATLRAVVSGRIPAGETLHFVFESQTKNLVEPNALPFPSETVGTTGSRLSVISLVGEHGKDGVARYTHPKNAVLAAFHRSPAVELFLRQKGVDALIFLSPEKKSAIAYVGNLSLSQWHTVQSTIPRLLPWYFEEQPLADTEKKLLSSLLKKTSHEYESIMSDLASGIDFRGEHIRSQLKGFDTLYEQKKIEEVSAHVQAKQAQIDHYYNQIGTLMREIDKAQMEQFWLEAKFSAGGDSELMSYFLRNKNLSLVKTEGTSITFVVRAYLDSYDPDQFTRLYKNRKSALYQMGVRGSFNGMLNEVDADDMSLLYHAVFGEETLKLKVCAAYQADINLTQLRTGIKGQKNFTSYPAEVSDCLRHPHIHSMGCIGNFHKYFLQAMQRRDYVAAIEQAFLSASNINFSDPPALLYMTQYLMESDAPCLEAPDGTSMTRVEAIQWLRKRQKESA